MKGIASFIDQLLEGEIYADARKSINGLYPGYLSLLSKLEKNDVFQDHLFSSRDEILAKVEPVIVVELVLKEDGPVVGKDLSSIAVDSLTETSVYLADLSNEDLTISVTVDESDSFLRDCELFAYDDVASTFRDSDLIEEYLANQLNVITSVKVMLVEARQPNRVPVCYTIDSQMPVVSSIQRPVDKQKVEMYLRGLLEI